MSQKISRRELGKATLLGAAALTVPAISQQSAPPPTPETNPEARIPEIEKKLAKPLSDEAKEIMKSMLNDNQKAYAARWESKPPENSEPCFLYVALPPAVRK